MSLSLDHTTQVPEVKFERLKHLSQIEDEWISQVKDMKVDPGAYKEAMYESTRRLGLVFGLYAPDLSGFLWVELDSLENVLWIPCYSVDKSVWHTRNHLKALISLLESLKSILKVEKVRWFTNRPGLYRRLGYKPSKRILMEA